MQKLIITGGHVVDPRNGIDGPADVAISAGKISEVGSVALSRAQRVIEAEGKYVLPGLVDCHVHTAGHPEAYRMLAQAGVTCALDLAGRPQTTIPEMLVHGCGLTVGFLFPLIPNETVDGTAPSDDQLRKVTRDAIGAGALGTKVLGGHYPLTPDATARAIRAAHDIGCWCAVHAGTTETGSDIEGLEELVTLAESHPLHIAHINSYCRGQVTGDPLLEASRAIRALGLVPQCRSESYLATINGTSAAMVDGIPKSNATKTCLRLGGYPGTSQGMEQAILDSWAQVNVADNGVIILASPQHGLKEFRARHTHVRVSFPVNSAAAAIGLATARKEDAFVVNALATDGGSIPRNVTLQKGFALVRFGALTMAELVSKACSVPAEMLGLDNKGHLGTGADADVCVVDPDTARADIVLAEGHVIADHRGARGGGARVLALDYAAPELERQRVPYACVAPSWLTDSD
ncbi:MAG: amidohydrolase family protein [Lentisphaerae bacterium]|jgi:hypothetical protein|nr:amidohydrolase family protein [Lentisphaerota bacterium]MBT4820492.1 amidohydrolase family protein [Lentisphaerota bacterium]MBT5608772.1 amidohydrolase family protein [Lentisphaerota bacterium]MBT7058283.1 amidohydrolase family protein [Lentisphaerota bacterium]MBT7840258.1 amidohydrolase family protein [Lentisphaerota bacterium]